MEAAVRMDRECPQCHAVSGQWAHASYERNRIIHEDGAVLYQRIAVRRFICTGCGRTYTVVPDDMPAHCQYTSGFIRSILEEYRRGDGNVIPLCACYQVTPAMLYRWRDRYRMI